MKRIINILFIAWMAVSLSGCIFPADGYESSFASTDVEGMEELSKLLKQNSIQHHFEVAIIPLFAEISYNNEDKKSIDELREKLHSAVSARFDNVMRECNIKAFTELDIEYSIKEKKDGVWVKWIPEKEKEQQLDGIVNKCMLEQYKNDF